MQVLNENFVFMILDQIHDPELSKDLYSITEEVVTEYSSVLRVQ